MDTQTSRVTDTLDTELSRARAQLERLTSAADDAEAEAERCRISFEREPTAQAHTSSVVAAQKSKNARADAERFERETLGPLAERQRTEADAVERELLRTQTDWQHAEAELDRMEGAIHHCHGELGSAAAMLAEFLDLRRQAAPRATSLGLQIGSARYESLIQQLHQRLQPLASGSRAAFVSLGFADQGNEQTLRLEIRLPLTVNSYVR